MPSRSTATIMVPVGFTASLCIVCAHSNPNTLVTFLSRSISLTRLPTGLQTLVLWRTTVPYWQELPRMLLSWHSETNIYKQQSMAAKKEKYIRLAEREAREKQQRIKDVQQQWKSRFVEDEGAKGLADLGKQEGPNEADEEVQRAYEEDARRQHYAEFDGQKVYLAGLDVSLLKKQKQVIKEASASNTQKLLDRVAEKVKVADKINKASGNKLYRAMLANMWQEQPECKCLFDLNTYYQFDLTQAGPSLPKTIHKKPPKHLRHPSPSGLTVDLINELEEMIERNNKRKQLMAVFSTRMEPQGEQQQVEEDSDDIFDTDKKAPIEIGKKLDFGMEEQRPTPAQITAKAIQQQPQTVEHFANQEEQLLKLQRLKKKRKLIEDEINKPSYMQTADPYSECFWNTGPTLEETNELKKHGVAVVYGEEKEIKRKEKKINYNKQYEKIQRVIAEKEQKK